MLEILRKPLILKLLSERPHQAFEAGTKQEKKKEGAPKLKLDGFRTKSNLMATALKMELLSNNIGPVPFASKLDTTWR